MVHLRRWIIPKQLGRHQRPIRPAIRPFTNDSSCVLHLAPDPGNTWLDHSGQGNHATNHGATITGEGRFGRAMRFNGVNNYIEIPDAASIKFGNTNFTLSCWIKTDTNITDRQHIIGKKWDIYAGNIGYAMYINAAKIESRIADGSNQATLVTDISTKKWYNVATVRDGNDFTLYINGIAKKTTTLAVGDTNNTYPFRCGYAPSSKYPYNGLIDEVALFNRALTASEIKTLYELGAV